MPRRQAARERLGGVADLALATEEDEHVAGTVAQQLLDGVADRVDRVVLLGERAAGSAPRRDTCARRPRRPARRRSGALKRRGSIVALVMTSLRSGRWGSSRCR